MAHCMLICDAAPSAAFSAQGGSPYDAGLRGENGITHGENGTAFSAPPA